MHVKQALNDCGYMVKPDRIGLSHITMLPLDGGAVTCLSIHASAQIRMVGDLADSATLGGALALSTSG